jgi:hypothetical protein
MMRPKPPIMSQVKINPSNLDLDEEGGEHEGEGSAVDDEFLAAYFTRFF